MDLSVLQIFIMRVKERESERVKGMYSYLYLFVYAYVLLCFSSTVKYEGNVGKIKLHFFSISLHILSLIPSVFDFYDLAGA